MFNEIGPNSEETKMPINNETHEEALEFNKGLESKDYTREELTTELQREMNPQIFLDQLKEKRDRDIFLDLIKIPGTTSHVFAGKTHGEFIKFIKAISDGYEFSNDPEKTKHSRSESFLSLHVTLADGYSTMLVSDYGVNLIGGHSGCGVILKPEFFLQKIGKPMSEIPEQYLKNPTTIPGNGRGRFNSIGVYRNIIDSNAPKVFGLFDPNKPYDPFKPQDPNETRREKILIIREDEGIRAATYKDGRIVSQPIAKEDVLVYFEVSRRVAISGSKVSGRFNVIFYDSNGNIIPKSRLKK